MVGYGDAPALEASSGTRSYAELLEEADRVERSLPASLEPDTAALLLAPRACPDTVLLLLAMWRRGVTVVFGDATIPSQRESELRDALPPAAVLRPTAQADDGHVVDVGDLHWRVAPSRGSKAFPYGCPDPAYVITTSGSTGRAKLVLCRHTGLSRVADALVDRYGYSSGSRVLQFAPPSYDAMLADAVVPLAGGSTLVFSPLQDPPSPSRICESLRAARITHVTFPPTVLRRLEGLVAPHTTVISAGEALDGVLAATVLARCGRLLNAYGPCEATIAATAFEVTADTIADEIPIGSPLPGVDVQLDRLPPAADVRPGTGMLTIGGAAVAWGYVTDDRLAAPSTPGFTGDGRFVTGDLAWRTDDGNFVFAGRIDRQIKRWGHRVELGAIETAIRRLPGVRDCVTRVDGVELHAFVVATSSEDEIVAAARQLLPRHELPTHWHLEDALPALPSDKSRGGTTPSELPEPSSPAHRMELEGVDERLVALWTEFLGPPDGPDADAFAAGGDSLALVLLLGAVATEFDIEIDPAEFLERPTLGALADRIAG